MFDSPVIDLVILLTFTYFTSSLILSSINEGISQGLFHLREKNLQKAIELLFITKTWKSYIKSDFIKSAHIQSLMKKAGKYPTHIPANNFFLFVVEKLGSENYQEGKLQVAIAASNLPDEFKQVLLDIAAQGNNRLAAFEKNLTQFYENAMDRSTIWYRRKIRRILLTLGIIFAVALNIDTIKIANDALNNPKNMGQTVDNIIAHLPAIQANSDSTTTVKILNNNGKVMISQGTALDTSYMNAASENGVSALNNIKNVQVFYEESTGYFLGYKQGEFRSEWLGGGFLGFIKKVFGILLTAFAVQMGSNFWFDLMKKAISLRAPGAKSITKTEEEKK